MPDDESLESTVSFLLKCPSEIDQTAWNSRLPLLSIIQDSTSSLGESKVVPRINDQMRIRYRRYIVKTSMGGVEAKYQSGLRNGCNRSSFDITDLPDVSLRLIRHTSDEPHKGVLLLFDEFPLGLIERSEQSLEREILDILVEPLFKQTCTQLCVHVYFFYDCEDGESQIYVTLQTSEPSEHLSFSADILSSILSNANPGDIFEGALAFPLNSVLLKKDDIFERHNGFLIPHCVRCLLRLDTQIVRCRLFTSLKNYVKLNREKHNCFIQSSLSKRKMDCSECIADGIMVNSAADVDLWVCLICGHVGCGRYNSSHALKHYSESGHSMCAETTSNRYIWDYNFDAMVNATKFDAVEEYDAEFYKRPMDTANKVLTAILENNGQKYEKLLSEAEVQVTMEVELADKREKELAKNIHKLKRMVNAGKTVLEQLEITKKDKIEEVKQQLEIKNLYKMKIEDMKRQKLERENNLKKLKEKLEEMKRRLDALLASL
ncbi:hypothetical protein ACOME3_001351 [Neoechinorhynchus agilis]